MVSPIARPSHGDRPQRVVLLAVAAGMVAFRASHCSGVHVFIVNA